MAGQGPVYVELACFSVLHVQSGLLEILVWLNSKCACVCVFLASVLDLNKLFFR